jgi:tetratricopeptide (TPR) repeat protein
VEKIPFVLLAAPAAAIAFMAQSSLHAAVPLAQLSVLGRLTVSAYGLSFYLWKMVVPLNLSPLYELPPTVDPWGMPFILSCGVVLAITAIVLALRRRVPGLPAAWLAYVVVLFPVLGIFQSGPQIAADRYTYLAGLGWAILAGAAVPSWWPASRFLINGPALCALLGLGVLTWNQVHVWHDSEKLWAHALAVDPKSPMAEFGLGRALADQGKPAEAIDHYRQALQIRPAYADAHYNWGVVLARQGKPAEAIDHYQRALRINPDFADAHYNWGNALARQGKPAEAVEHYRQALKIKPDVAEAVSNLASALAQQGKLAEASEQFRQALRLKPDSAYVHYNFGLTLAQQGKPAEASGHFQEALRINPNDADAHYNWGNALARQGKLTEAVEHYQRALQISPDFALARSSLLKALPGVLVWAWRRP